MAEARAPQHDTPPADRNGRQTDTSAASVLTMTLIVVVLVAEIILTWFGLVGRMTGIALVGAHLALVAVLACGVWRPMVTGSDGGLALMAVIGTFAVGPFGAAGALLLPALARADPTDTERLQAWYDRIALSTEQDQLTQLSDRIAIGRSANLSAPTPAELTAEFAIGSIGAQQTALGMIARHFDASYLPVLALALDSPEPVIRVQGAAVAARVREILKRDLPAMLARATTPELALDDALGIAGKLEALVGSGLLETAAATDAARVASGLRARVVARLDADNQQKVGGIEFTSSAVADTYLAHLIAQGRLADFRAARMRTRIPVIGRYRHRRIAVNAKASSKTSHHQPGAHA